MSRAPDLSIVLVSYNDAACLGECLRSIDAACDGLGVETIVVDNGDDHACIETTSHAGIDVAYVSMAGNAGFARAANAGLARARGRFLLLLNPDTVLAPGSLAAAVTALAERPEVGMLGCKLVKPDGSLDHACKRSFPTPLGALAYFTRLDALPFISRRGGGYRALHVRDDDESRVDAVNGAFMLVRREAYTDVGPLDERFWMYGEDLDWCLRFWSAGWPVLYFPAVEARHSKGGSSGQVRPRRVNWAFHESMWLFFEKHHRRRRLVRGLVHAAVLTRFAVSEIRATGRRRALRARTARG